MTSADSASVARSRSRSSSTNLSSTQNEHTRIGITGLRRLCSLLKNEGDRVLSGQSTFTLTSDVLSYLQVSCRRHSISLNEEASAAPDPPIRMPTFVISSGRARSQTVSNSFQEEWNRHIQFIKDFMLSTPNLKVIHNQGTLSFPISLHRFVNLSSLQLRRVPIHMVEGLQMLRSTLVSLTIYRGINKLSDLLESCGGDRSAPLTWPKLKVVCLMFNTILCLDDSLRFLPYLEALDLSHNSLVTCETYLEYLSDLISISLAYNLLTSVPSFSVSTKASLVSLSLRGNNLDNIKGLEELSGLKELDLGENCLNDHSFLEPLAHLNRLRVLQLDANPLFYHRKHRALTASCLSRRALVGEFELDKRKLTTAEIFYFGPRRLQVKKIDPPSINVDAPDYVCSTPDRGPSPSSGIGTENESVEILLKSPRKGKRKRMKPRQTEILETSGDFTSSVEFTPGTTPHNDELSKLRTLEAKRTREKVEELRRHYGPNWLQAMQEQDIFNAGKQSESPKYQAGAAACADPDNMTAKSLKGKTKFAQEEQDRMTTATESESHYKNDTGEESERGSKILVDSGSSLFGVNSSEIHSAVRSVVKPSVLEDKAEVSSSTVEEPPQSNPIMAALARLAAAQSADEGVDSQDNADRGSGPSLKMMAQVRQLETITTSRSQSSHSSGDERSKVKPLNISDNQYEVVVSNQKTIKAEVHPQASSMRSGMGASGVSGNESKELMVPRDDMDGRNHLHGSNLTALERNFSVDSNTDIHCEEKEVIETLFASLPKDGNKMILLSFSSSYLLEKDITGRLKEKLELGSLISVDEKPLEMIETEMHREQNSSDSLLKGVKRKEGEAGVELTLKFDYISRDRQKRVYKLDQADAKVVVSHLQPFLDARLEETKAKLMVVMQCLKCNRTFLKKDVLQKEKQLPLSGNFKDLKSWQEMMDKTTFLCPKCGSNIVIELDPAIHARGTTASTTSRHAKSASSTPVGSVTSSEGWMEKAKPKPSNKMKRMKTNDNFENSSGFVSAQRASHRRSFESLDVFPSRSSSLRSEDSTKDKRSDSTNTRERSNAFSAQKTMHRSVAITKRERRISDHGGFLNPVEDYFAEEQHQTLASSSSTINSAKLAEMTTSLRGDASTQGPTAAVKRKTSPVLNIEDSNKTELSDQAKSSDAMTDSGFESGVNSQSLVQEKSSDLSEDGISRSLDVRSHDKSSQEKKLKGLERQQRRESTSSYKHISAMEELVNSMVLEGHSLGGQQNASGGSDVTKAGQKSMSVSAFREFVSSSPSLNNSRRERSGSRSSVASSIAVLSSGNSNNGDEADMASINFAVGDTGSIDSNTAANLASAVKSVGIYDLEENSNMKAKGNGEGEDEAVPRVVSPLSSNICSSMVSSVYESSVRGGGPEDGQEAKSLEVSTGATDTKVMDKHGVWQEPVAVGSSSSSSEDLTSIYDMPHKLKKPSSSSKRSSELDNMDGTDVTRNLTKPSERNTSAIFRTCGNSDEMNVSGNINLTSDNKATSDPAGDEAGAKLQHLCTPAFSGDSHENIKTNEDRENEDLSGSTDEDGISQLELTPQYAFHHLNHRLMLHLMMTLFEPNEEFVCKIQGEICQYIIEESFEGIFVMTSARFYILKITSEDHSGDPSEWLACTEIQPIPELRYIDLGLGGHSLRIEFVTDCSSYTIVTRNRDRTSQFVEILHENLARYAVTNGVTSHVVLNEDVDQVTVNNLDKDILSRVVPDQSLLLYCMGYIERGNVKKFPVSFVLSSMDLCLVRTCHQWPQPRLQAPITVETVGRQFVLLERQPISNVASVTVDEDSMKKIQLELFNEKEGVSTLWNINMSTRQTTVDFVHALSVPWEKEFGVEMDVCYSQLEF